MRSEGILEASIFYSAGNNGGGADQPSNRLSPRIGKYPTLTIKEFIQSSSLENVIPFARQSTTYRFFSTPEGQIIASYMMNDLFAKLHQEREQFGNQTSHGGKRLPRIQEKKAIDDLRAFIFNNPRQTNLLSTATDQQRQEIEGLLEISTSLDEFIAYAFSGLVHLHAAKNYAKFSYKNVGQSPRFSFESIFWAGYYGISRTLLNAPNKYINNPPAYMNTFIVGDIKRYLSSLMDERIDVSIDKPFGDGEEGTLKDIIPSFEDNPQEGSEYSEVSEILRKIIEFFPPGSMHYKMLQYFLQTGIDFKGLAHEVFPQLHPSKLVNIWHVQVKPAVEMLYLLYSNPEAITVDKTLGLFKKQGSLEQYLEAHINLSENPSDPDAISRIHSATMLLDSMDISIGEKLAYLVLSEQKHHKEEKHYEDNIYSDLHVATLFGLAPDLVNSFRQLHINAERFDRFTRWSKKVHQLQHEGRDLGEVVEVLTEYRYWVYEMLIDPSYQRLMWKDLALLMPEELRLDGLKPVEAGFKMFQAATVLENHFLLDEVAKGRLALRNAATYKMIQEYALRPENRDRRITHKEFAELLGLFKVKSITEILKRMRAARIPIPTNIGEQGRPQEEIDEQLTIAQEVIQDLTRASGGQAPTIEVIQAELDARGMPEIRYGLLISDDYRKDTARKALIHIHEALDELASDDTLEARAKVKINDIIQYLAEKGITMSYPQMRHYYVDYRDELRVGQKKAEITPEVIDAIKKLSGEGLSSYAIAEKLGISPATVQNRLRMIREQ